MAIPFRPLVVLGLIVFAGSLASPYVAVRGMRAAAEAHDAETLVDYVDFAALRENLKADFQQALAAQQAAQGNPGAGASFGSTMAAAFLGPMVDAMVTPDNLSMMIRGQAPPMAPGAPRPPTSGEPSPEISPEISMGYEDPTRFVVSVRPKGIADQALALIFSRQGLFSWKLTALRMPTPPTRTF